MLIMEVVGELRLAALGTAKCRIGTSRLFAARAEFVSCCAWPAVATAVKCLFSASVVARRVESRITIHALNADVSEAVHAEVVLSLFRAVRTASLRAPLREIPALVAGPVMKSNRSFFLIGRFFSF